MLLNLLINNYCLQCSWGKVIFSQASVILSTGGITWAYTPPGPGTPPGTRYTPWHQVHPWHQEHPLDQVHPPDQVHPQTRYPARTRYTPLGPGTPPGPGIPPRPGTPPRTRYPPPSSACREIQATSGRYASYWNAFLLSIKITDMSR